MKKILIIISSLFLLGCENATLTTNIETTNNSNSSTFYVEIKGEVINPGIYEVSTNMLVYDLIRLAGGFTLDASSESINLVLPLTANQLIVIPAKSESLVNSKININQATQAELETLPGIGAGIARKIIDYRKQHPFTCIEDLLEVSGIGPSIFQKIQEYITV